jgi:hypothetical protein
VTFHAAMHGDQSLPIIDRVLPCTDPGQKQRRRGGGRLSRSYTSRRMRRRAFRNLPACSSASALMEYGLPFSGMPLLSSWPKRPHYIGISRVGAGEGNRTLVCSLASCNTVGTLSLTGDRRPRPGVPLSFRGPPRIRVLARGSTSNPFSKDSGFRQQSNDGNLRHPRVSTVVLHRPHPVAQEMPGLIGFFARRD